MWELIDAKSGDQVRLGDYVTTFRGETGTLTAVYPPHKPSSEGKVAVEVHGRSGVLYPSVIGCSFRYAR